MSPAGDLAASAASPTPVAMPATPQPHHASLPSDIPQGGSPTASMVTADQSSPAQPHESQSHEVNKYSSPPTQSSSITPPPSSQPLRRVIAGSPVLRATTPTLSMLSSPPPTHINGVKREVAATNTYAVPSSQQIAGASVADLKELLHAAIVENSRLEANLGEARMSAAHYKLQHQLLAIETEDNKHRMEVEHDMTRREVEVLRMAEQAREARQNKTSPRQSASSRYIADLKAYCEAMDAENRLLSKRLEKAKNIISNRDETLENVLEENRSYIRRIRENREHLNRLRSPGGIYSAAPPRQPGSSYPVTPQQYMRGTPKASARSIHHQDHGDSQDSFAALLLADRVLNQENNSAPSTPTMSARPAQRSHLRHNRNVQSLSSLPSTPVRARHTADQGHLLPSVQFVPQSEPRYRSTQQYHESPRERSRKSRDSTISVEDAEEIAEYNRSSMADEDIEESQASQNASQMLRRDPRQSFEVLGSPVEVGPAQKSGLLQAKLFGNVTKPGVEKRKRVEEEGGHTAKKAKVQEGVGLGIGGW